MVKVDSKYEGDQDFKEEDVIWRVVVIISDYSIFPVVLERSKRMLKMMEISEDKMS